MASSTDSISIPAPLRGASGINRKPDAKTRFQYQPLYEGLPVCVVFDPSAFVFQYQPLYEGLPQKLYAISDNLISIPAPLRGASSNDGQLSEILQISIPAPLRGASHAPLGNQGATYDFNTSPSTRGFSNIAQ